MKVRLHSTQPSPTYRWALFAQIIDGEWRSLGYYRTRMLAEAHARATPYTDIFIGRAERINGERVA